VTVKTGTVDVTGAGNAAAALGSLSGADRGSRHSSQKAKACGRYELPLPLIFVAKAIADGFLQQFLQFPNHLGIDIHLDLTLAPNQQGELTVRMGGKRLFELSERFDAEFALPSCHRDVSV
jgi:hypothetical protein